jgi:hypothetical protein
MLGTTLLALIALFVVFAFILLKVEGLALFAPKSTAGVANSAAAYCADQCRLTDGRCPMTGSRERALNCPLWKFVEADVPTVLYGSPFAHLQTSRKAA